MPTLAGLTEAVLSFVVAYGLLAFLLFVVLETSFILHFVPSEVVVPVAAAALVTDLASFVLFVAVATGGSVVGSLIAYWFGWSGDQLFDRYADRLGLHDEIDRSKRWFARHGDGLMFWGRLIPILRTPISIPAGFAGMDRRRFVAYSTGGWFCYNLLLTWLVYDGADGVSPLGHVLATARSSFGAQPVLTIVVCAVVLTATTAGWYHRRTIGRVLR